MADTGSTASRAAGSTPLKLGLQLGLLLLLAVLLLLPLLWLLSTSLKGPQENIFTSPPALLPAAPSLEAYRQLFTTQPMLAYLRNSTIVSALAVLANLLFCSLAAYPLARLRFAGRGLVLALVRWPALERWAAPLAEIESAWRIETLAQFAPDGGNREQALNYQLFSFEFCWQVRQALGTAGRPIPGDLDARLAAAARFFCDIQVPTEPWDYGDSDSAYVTPLFTQEAACCQEWWHWFRGEAAGESIRYWIGPPPPPPSRTGAGEGGSPLEEVAGWQLYPDSRIAFRTSGPWQLRWDLSPLGYLKTAAHGHLDALHLSVWLKGVAVLVDPGTGAYYADKRLRAWLASRAAHNGPSPLTVPEEPRRLGPFLWQSHHEVPRLAAHPDGGGEGELRLPGYQLRRRILPVPEGSGWRVEDRCLSTAGGPAPFTVRWQFAPGARLLRQGDREFILRRGDLEVRMSFGPAWAEVLSSGDRPVPPDERSLDGVVSPAFRRVERAPFLLLTGLGGAGAKEGFVSEFRV